MYKRRKSRFIKQLSKDTTAYQAEYNNLNNQLIMRIDTTHYIWYGSMIVQGVLLTIGVKEPGNSFLFSFSIILMIPFILSMGYQLECICGMRTYIITYLSDKLDVSYEKNINLVSYFANKKRGLLSVIWVPHILLMPYYFYSFLSLCLALKIPEINLSTEAEYLPNILNMLKSNALPLIVWTFTNMLFLITAKEFLNIFSEKKWMSYMREWNKTINKDTVFKANNMHF
ncbi:hypothetical protein HGP28_01990 [Vibrio sp. SM6]|uniref:Uncharacterized protein n=1 Tax=Vibrio agarilyticus TaxID=2726741 RepID=A0A7X8TN68_9VIBR|nr:hypothetical protein [Vibrio agarilyticus]NLS11659.1 hypothetical protein [Vibrio agarilyticus]